MFTLIMKTIKPLVELVKNTYFIVVSVIIFAVFSFQLIAQEDYGLIQFVFIIIFALFLFVRLYMARINQNALVDSDLFSFGIKILLIDILMFLCMIFSKKYFIYISQIVGLSLLVESLTQLAKIYNFSQKLVVIKNLPEHKVNLDSKEIEKIMRIINPENNKFYIEEDDAIDGDTLKRLQDIYVLKEEIYKCKRNQKLEAFKIENEIIKIKKHITKNTRVNTSLINRKRK